MVKLLRETPATQQNSLLIHQDFLAYIEAVKNTMCDRRTNLDRLENLRMTLSQEVKADAGQVLAEVDLLQDFLLTEKPIQTYVPVSLQESKKEIEPDQGFDGPSF